MLICEDLKRQPNPSTNPRGYRLRQTYVKCLHGESERGFESIGQPHIFLTPWPCRFDDVSESRKD